MSVRTSRTHLEVRVVKGASLSEHPSDRKTNPRSLLAISTNQACGSDNINIMQSESQYMLMLASRGQPRLGLDEDSAATP